MARISDVVKTYKLINDPNAPNWSVRFVGGIAIVALLLAGGGALVWAAAHDKGPAPNHMVVASTENSDGTWTDEIYLANFNAALAPDYDALDTQLELWRAQHPSATIVSESPIYDNVRVHKIGYKIVYR